MSASSMRPPRSASTASYQSSSPNLPSPLNHSPDSFSPPLPTGHTSRDSPVGEMSDTLSPLRERPDSVLTSSPRPSPGVVRPRTSSFSRSPRSCTSPERSLDIGPPPLQPHCAYVRHHSPRSSPLAQGIPFPSSSPLLSSPLLSSPLAGSQPSVPHSPRAVSPSNSPRRSSSVLYHSDSPQFQPRPLPHLIQSQFHLSQSPPVQIVPSPPRFPRTQSLIQQSVGHNVAALASSSPSNLRNRRISMDAEPCLHPFTCGSPVPASQPFTQDTPMFAEGESTPLNEPPIRWWGGRRSWLDDWDNSVKQHQATWDTCAVNSPCYDELGSAIGMRFVHPGHENPLLLRDDELRASLAGVGTASTRITTPGFTHTPSGTNAGHEIEGIPFPRAVPMPIASGVARSGSHDGSGHGQLHVGPPPIEGGFIMRGTQANFTQRVAHHLQGNACVSTHDDIMSLRGQERGNDRRGHEHVSGQNRRFSNASTRSSTSYISCTSGPSQSHSQSLLMSSSQSHTSTYPSLNSLGIGIEEMEREQRRSRTYWARRSSGSTLERQSKDVGRDAATRSEDGGLHLNEPEEHVDNTAGTDVDEKQSVTQSRANVPMKYGSIFWRGSKHTNVSDEEAQRDGYSRAEKCVSLAITSILPTATIAMLSPIGEALIKAKDSAVFVGKELAPVAKDTLTVSADLLSCAPLPGLEEAAKALLSVWEACQKMDTNRLACLRLAERCATLLYSVRWDVEETSCQAALAEPVERLCGALAQIQKFLDTQRHRPFLKRYVRREEITRELQACNDAITDAASRFGISVQVRTYNEVCLAAFDAQRLAHETQAMLSLDRQLILEQREMWRQLCAVVTESSGENAMPPPAYGQLSLTLAGPDITTDELTPAEFASASGHRISTSSTLPSGNVSDVVDSTLSVLPTPTPTQATFAAEETQIRTMTTEKEVMVKHPKKVRQALKEVHLVQDSVDSAADEAALQGTLVGALNTKNDVEIVRCLQVARGEIPEATETLRRMLGMGKTKLETAEHNANTGDTELDRKFMQSGMEAMMRLTTVVTKQPQNEGEDGEHGEGAGAIGASGLPSWTITRYEVLRTRKIGKGFFSDVYLGHWRKLTVVIKVLAHCVSREAFVRYVELWNTLDHPNVLPLYGASSAVGENPWFLVSKFCGGDNLVTSLKRAKAVGAMTVGDEATVRIDLLRLLHEIAKGMAYLHGRGVLHGNLRAANVLVDENGRCVLSDFGQFEIRSESHRSCGQLQSHPIRWRAPEMLMGNDQPTEAADVYAFSMCCVEILSMGDLPWAKLDDKAIRELIMDKDERPPIPMWDGSANVAYAIANLVQSCWLRQPDLRPPFSSIVASLEGIFKPDSSKDSQVGCASPLRSKAGIVLDTSTESSPADEYYETASESMRTGVEETVDDMMDISLTSPTPALGNTRFVFHDNASNQTKFVNVMTQPMSRPDSTPTPSPTDKLNADLRYEANYRLIAGSNHTFHHSLTLPLWSPTRVELGAVGYLSKPKGEFITLFNAIDPLQSCDDRLHQLPSMYGYGKFEVQRREEGKRNVAQRGFDAISGFLTFKPRGDRSHPERIARQYTFSLVQGTPSAHLCVEKTVHRYIDRLEVPMKWFKQHVDLILEVCTPLHVIQREDLILVVGTLDAPDWAVFVSNDHVDCRAQFNVFASREKGESWGMYTVEPTINAGPDRMVEASQVTFANKVSCVTADVTGDTVMLAGLRFEQGLQAPTMM